MNMKTVYKIGISVSPFFLFILVASPVHAEEYGWSPQVDFSNQGTPTCTDAKPDKAPVLLQPNHPDLQRATGPGQVRLQWHKVPGATGYNVYFGLSPKNYIFSAPDLPDTNNYTVSHLGNRVYYFAVQARKGCAASGLSQEWAGRPGGGGIGTTNAVLGISDYEGVAPVVRKNAYVAPPAYEEESDVQGTTDEAEEAPSYVPPVNDQPAYRLPTTPPAARNQLTPTPAKKGFWQNLLNALGLGK